MSTSNMAIPAASRDRSSSTGVYSTGGFWEHLWRTSGIHFVIFAVLASVIYGYQPQVGATSDQLVAFYDGQHVRILIAVVVSALAVLNLMWFTAALRAVLADAGRDGWGAAATAASAVTGAAFLLLLTVTATLTHSATDSGNSLLTLGLNDFSWAGVVLSSFPRAMLIMAGTFGLWRAGLISNALFAAGVVAVVMVLLGGSTWMSDGFWAPDGAYSRFVSPVIGLAWVLGVSRILLSRAPAIRIGW